MLTRQRRRSPLRLIWLPLMTVAFLSYFAFHAFSGSYGLDARGRIESELSSLKDRLKTLKEERAKLEARLAYLKPESLDADILDIEARTSLNLLRPDEVVISFGAVQHSAN